MCIRDRHGVDQTDAVSLVSLDVQSRVDQLLCHAHADQTSQTLGAAEARGDAQTDFQMCIRDSSKGKLCDKAAFFLFIFAGGRAPDGAVILHVRSS